MKSEFDYRTLNIAPFLLRQDEIVNFESNSSIILKISWKYRAKPGHISRYVLENNKGISEKLASNIAVSANSVTDKSLKVTQRLKELTGLETLCGSFSYLRDVLDHGAHGLISPYKKWCASCYEESLANNTVAGRARVSDHLYWSLSLAEYCPEHLCTLSDRCGRCFQRQPFISSSIEPGFCQYCFNSLSLAPRILVQDDEDAAVRRSHILRYDIFCPGLNLTNRRLSIGVLAKNLRSICDLGEKESLEKLAFQCGVSRYALKDWCLCRHGISLESLFSLQNGLGISRLSELFAPTDQFQLATCPTTTAQLNFRTKLNKHCVLPAISRYFEAVGLGDEAPLSRAEVASRFGVSVGMLENAFRNEVKKLSDIYRKHKNSESLKTKDRLQYEMNHAVRKCGAKGRRFDWAHVMAELGDFGLNGIRQSDLEAARKIAIKRYLESDRRDKTRDVDKLLCD